MASDRSDQEISKGRPWMAQVGKKLPPAPQAEMEEDSGELAELAQKASDAARQAARMAQSAANIADLAPVFTRTEADGDVLADDWYGEATVREAEAAVQEAAGSAARAAESATDARDDAALLDHAVQLEVDRSRNQDR